MSERNYYVICDDKCLFPGMTKDQILTAITQAVEGGEIHDVDTGFITKIKEANKNNQLKFWVGTQDEYIAQESAIEENTYCIITDDTLADDLVAQVEQMGITVSTYGDQIAEARQFKIPFQTATNQYQNISVVGVDSFADLTGKLFYVMPKYTNSNTAVNFSVSTEGVYYSIKVFEDGALTSTIQKGSIVADRPSLFYCDGTDAIYLNPVDNAKAWKMIDLSGLSFSSSSNPLKMWYKRNGDVVSVRFSGAASRAIDSVQTITALDSAIMPSYLGESGLSVTTYSESGTKLVFSITSSGILMLTPTSSMFANQWDTFLFNYTV